MSAGCSRNMPREHSSGLQGTPGRGGRDLFFRVTEHGWCIQSADRIGPWPERTLGTGLWFWLALSAVSED